MKIRLNGDINLDSNKINFENLEVEIISDSYNHFDDINTADSDYSELVALDEYISNAIDHYAYIIEHTDVDIRQILSAFIYELLGLDKET